MQRQWSGNAFGVIGIVSCTLVAVYLVRSAPSPDLLAAAESAYDRRDWPRAAQEARGVLKTRPADSKALLLLARASAREGKDETAVAIYRRVGTGAMGPEDLFLLGRVLLSRNQTGPGLAALGAAHDADPNHAETLATLITYLIANQSLTQAVQHAERLMKQPGWDLRGMLLLARVRRELLDPVAAATLLAGALQREPEMAHSGTDPREVRRLLATCLLETARPAEARAQLERALAFGSDPQASWLQSRSFLMEGKLAEARTALETARRGAGEQDPLRPEPAPFVGAARCATCHPKEFKSQQQSRHSQTIKSKPELKSLPWPGQPLVDLDNPRVTHVFQRADNAVEAQARVENQTLSALLEYAMGSNHQGRSFVGRDRRGQAREMRISEYPSTPFWSRTSEHPAEPPGPDGYLGRPIADESVRRCVHCHSTNFRAVQEPAGRPEASDHGIGCERCHGPGGHHVRAVAERFPDIAIARPRLASAERVVALCGQCHKAPESASSTSPNFIRFQAPTLVQSRCYTESGTLSCVSCHNPHENASRSPSDYESVCLQCHPSLKNHDEHAFKEVARPKTWAACPTRAERDCLSCHMPRVPDAVPRTIFTDHFIRIRSNSGRP